MTPTCVRPDSVLHVAGKSVRSQASDFANPEWAQHCVRCGALLTTRIFGYPEGAVIIEDAHSIAMYIGDAQPNCSRKAVHDEDRNAAA